MNTFVVRFHLIFWVSTYDIIYYKNWRWECICVRTRTMHKCVFGLCTYEHHLKVNNNWQSLSIIMFRLPIYKSTGKNIENFSVLEALMIKLINSKIFLASIERQTLNNRTHKNIRGWIHHQDILYRHTSILLIHCAM